MFTSFHPRRGRGEVAKRWDEALNEPTRIPSGSRTIRDIDIGPFPRGSDRFIMWPAELGFEDWHSSKCTMLLRHLPATLRWQKHR